MLGLYFRQIFHYQIEQISYSFGLLRRYSYHVAHSQRIEIVKIILFVIVEFVYRDYHGLFAGAQKVCHLHIVGGHSRFAVHDKDNLFGYLHGYSRLLADMSPHLVFALYLQSARIYKRKIETAPLCIAVQSVARNSFIVFDYAYFFSYYSVEKRRLAYVGSAYYRN